MHSPQGDKGLEDEFGLAAIDDLDSLFPDTNAGFHFGEEKAITNVNVSNESTYKHTPQLAQTPKHDSDPDLVGDGLFQKSSTTLTAPPSSRSNPETPKEQFEFSLGDFAPAMTRIFSEQSGLASLNPRQSNHPENVHQAMIMNHRQKHHLVSSPMRRSETYRWEEAGATASSSDVALSIPATAYNQHQAGLDFGVPYGFGARHSHMRTPLRPSNLRNSISSQPSDLYPSVSEVSQSNPQFMHAITDPSAAQENGHGYRNRRHTDAELLSRNPFAGTYPVLDNSQMYGGLMGNLGNYADPSRGYSHPYQARSMYLSQGLQGNLVHPSVDSHQQISGMLLQQPTNVPPFMVRPAQQSAFGQRMHTTMKREPQSSGSCVGQESYQSTEDPEVPKSVQTREPSETLTAPITAEENEMYLNKILAAMYDTSRAQDNAGMISTWKTQMNDKEAVEGIAKDLLEVCKKRDALGRPFRKGLKPSHRFQTFREHFDALIEALTTQKTMCKHLLRQPYIEEIVDDPLGSIARITNNRKVNKGKKLAIEKGREALGQEGKARRLARISSRGETDDDEQDAENESFDETKYENLLKRSSTLHHRRSIDDDTHDPSYHEGSAPKRAKRASRSKYQLNERNEMIDTSESPASPSTYHHGNRNDILATSGRANDERASRQQSSYVMSHRRQGYDSTGLSDMSHHSSSGPLFPQADNAGNEYSAYKTDSVSRPRRNPRR